MRRQTLFHAATLLAISLVLAPAIYAQSQDSAAEIVQVSPPQVPRVEPPQPTATAQELEQKGDELRGRKDYLDALDYYRAAVPKNPHSAPLVTKVGITELMLQNFKLAERDFRHAIKMDHNYASAYNNLGVVWYSEKKYNKAISECEKAIKLNPDSASFYNNLGAAYYSKRQFEKATTAFGEALSRDPDIFEHTSHSGIQAQLSSPGDRARYDYLLAKLYAKAGDADRALECLKRSMEEGYKGINDVYKDPEFVNLRNDARFGQLMAARPPAIPE